MWVKNGRALMIERCSDELAAKPSKRGQNLSREEAKWEINQHLESWQNRRKAKSVGRNMFFGIEAKTAQQVTWRGIHWKNQSSLEVFPRPKDKYLSPARPREKRSRRVYSWCKDGRKSDEWQWRWRWLVNDWTDIDWDKIEGIEDMDSLKDK